jgi:autotransporter-associated beta strand protein
MKRVSSASFRRALRAGGAVLAAGALAAALSAQPIDFLGNTGSPAATWSNASGAVWATHEGSNLAPDTYPNAASVTVQRVANTSTANLTQDVVAGVTVGSLLIGGNTSNTWNVLPVNGITFDNGGAGSVISVNSTSAGARLVLNTGSITLADNLFVSNISYNAASTAGSIALLAPIGGTGNMTISNAINDQGRGVIRLEGLNTFAGHVTFAKGITTFTRSNSFGANANPVTIGVVDGGDVTVLSNATSGLNVYNPITVTASIGGTAIFGGSSNITTTNPATPLFHGPLTLNGDLTLLVRNTGAGMGDNIVTIRGNIGGAGNLTVTGSSNNGSFVTAQLLGNNTFTGATRVASGTLRLGAVTGTESLALKSSLVDLNGADAGTLQLGYTTTSANVSTPQSITSATFGGLTGSRGLTLQNIDAAPAAVALKVGQSGLDTQYDGVLSGPGSLEKVGAGQLKLTAAQEYTGPTTVTEGTLLLDASSSLHAQSAVTVGANGTLAGSGRIAGNLTLEAAGRIAATLPADPVALAPLRVDGSVTFTEGAAVALAGDEVAVGLTWTLVRAGSFAGPLPQLALPAGWHGSLAVVGDELRFTRQNQVASATAAWRELHFGSATIDASSAANADPEGDGWTNLVEFALGLDPLEPDGSAAVALATETDRLTLTFARHADPALTYAVEAANTPAGPWTVIWSSTGEQNIAGPVTVTDPVSLSAGPARFLRVSISTAAW